MPHQAEWYQTGAWHDKRRGITFVTWTCSGCNDTKTLREDQGEPPGGTHANP